MYTARISKLDQLKALVYFQGEISFHFVTRRNLPLTVLLLTSSSAAFYLLFEQDKHLMLVHLPFHNYWFQNGTQDLPNFNLVQTREYRRMCCMLQQYFLKAMCQ